MHLLIWSFILRFVRKIIGKRIIITSLFHVVQASKPELEVYNQLETHYMSSRYWLRSLILHLLFILHAINHNFIRKFLLPYMKNLKIVVFVKKFFSFLPCNRI